MTELPDRRVTLRDVAQLAGVHPTTASRILNGSRAGDPDAASRVHKAARALGYRANRIAQALRQQNTTTVGMVVPDLENPFFPALVKSVESALNLEGYALLLCDAQDDPRVERQRIDALLQRQVDGLILCPVHMSASVPAVEGAAQTVPTVQVDRRVAVTTDFVGVDQSAVVALVVDHLKSSGRHRLAFLTSADSVSTIAERTSAYQRSLAADPTSRDRIFVGSLTLHSGIEATSQLLSSGEPLPDALVCANDLIALGAMQRLRRAAIRVPDQIAVTGVDDTAFGQIAEPELTTVRQPIDQLGQEAVTMLLSRLRPNRRVRGATRTMVLTPELLIRRSTAPDVTDQAPATAAALEPTA
jgi:LacI family transcriptional regulator